MKRIKALAIVLMLSPAVFAASSNVTLNVDKKQKFLSVQTSNYSAQLPLGVPKGMELEGKPQFFGDQNYAIIMVGAADPAAATTIVHAVDSRGKKLWSLDMEVFNASTPLIEKDFVYLSGIGRVFKVDKKTGVIVWTHSGLFENKKYQFNGSETISRKNDQILFSDKVRVLDQTGKLLEGNL